MLGKFPYHNLYVTGIKNERIKMWIVFVNCKFVFKTFSIKKLKRIRSFQKINITYEMRGTLFSIWKCANAIESYNIFCVFAHLRMEKIRIAYTMHNMFWMHLPFCFNFLNRFLNQIITQMICTSKSWVNNWRRMRRRKRFVISVTLFNLNNDLNILKRHKLKYKAIHTNKHRMQ